MVIGVGMNVALPVDLAAEIGQPACALDEICAAVPPRNRLLATLLSEMARVLQQFAKNGFSGLRAEWERYHFHQGRVVQLQTGDGRLVSGIARGVNDNGELCLETVQGMQCFNSGEVRVQHES